MTSPLTAIDVVCFKWGPLYTADHVNRLRGMVVRNLPADVTVHCATDDPTGIDSDIRIHPLSDLPPLGWDAGHGNKLVAFSPDFLGLAGRHILVLDLDVVVVGSLDFVLDRPDVPFLIAPGHGQHAGTRGHAAVYRLVVGSRSHVWDDLVADPAAAIASCPHQSGVPGHLSEQMWLERTLPDMDFFPPGLVAYYRQDCRAQGRTLFGAVGRRWNLTTAMWGTATPPRGTKVVSFAGRVQPWEVAASRHGVWRRAPFVQENWRA